MKKITIALLMIIISIISVVSPVLAATGGNIEYGTYGTKRPSTNNVFDLSTGEHYKSYVETEGFDIYTNKCFIGTSSMAVYIYNRGNDAIKVTLCKFGFLSDNELYSLTTPHPSEIKGSTLNFLNLDKSQKYYLIFDSPCNCTIDIWGF